MGRRRRRKIWETRHGGSQDRWDDHEEPLDGDSDPYGDAGSPEVDLHGLTVERALRRIAGEVTRCRAGGARTLVVVTGRGYGSHAGKARLRPEVERWLKGTDAQRLGVGDVRTLPHGGAFEVTIAPR